MEMLSLLCIVFVTLTGLTKGAGVLPNGTLNAAVGGKVMFTTLTPPETPILTVKWTFAERNIITLAGVNVTAPEYEGRITLFISTGSLELRNLTLSDSGEYRVGIQPQGEFDKEGSTRLDVYERVSNVTVTHSSTDLVEFNSSFSLSCSASGSSLSFQWLHDTSVVAPSDRFQLTDGNTTLTIVNVTRYDQGPFRCHVSNPFNNGTSDPVTLSVNYGPQNVIFKLSPSQEYYEEGSEITLSCSAVSKPSALFYWFLNGSRLPHNRSEITIRSESGDYSCQAFNQKTLRYDTSSPLAVTVLERISGGSVTSSINLPIEGNSVNLTCDAAAGSVFTRLWKKDGSDLTLTENMTLYEENRVLSFHPLKKTDSGEYSCKISSPVSNDEAQYIMVVNYGPENVGITGPSEIDSEQTLTLTCTAKSEPSASYTWKLNGTEIHSFSVFTKVITELSDSGNYTCHAMNNITGRRSSAVHQVTVTATPVVISSGCSAGCIAGIVIACLVVIGAAVGGAGFYIYKRKKQPMTSSNSNTATTRAGDGQINTGYSANQELNYADVTFHRNRNGGRVQLGSQNETSDYAEVKANSSAAGSTPPTYDDHMQRAKRPAPQPGGYGVNVYAQVKKN